MYISNNKLVRNSNSFNHYVIQYIIRIKYDNIIKIKL